MTVSFQELPPEVIDVIVKFLDPGDIINLSECMRLMVTEEVYHHAFRDDTHFSHYDDEMFQGRKRAHLFVIGGNGRKPEFLMNVPSHYEFIYDKQYRRMHTPWKIKNEGSIVQACMRRGVNVLNSLGEFSFSWNYPSVPLRRPYEMEKKCLLSSEEDFETGRFEKKRKRFEVELAAFKRRRLAHHQDPEPENDYDDDYYTWESLDEGATAKLPPTPPAVIRFSQNLFSRPPRQPRFVRFGWHLSNKVAQDDAGIVWYYWDRWVPICLVDESTGELVTGTVLLWAETRFVVEGRGSWKFTYPPGWSTTCKPNGFRGGYPCLEDHCCYLQVSSIPGAHSVTDIVILGGSYRLLQDGYDTVERSVTELPQLLRLLKPHGRVIQAVWRDNWVALLTEGGVAGISTLKTSKENPRIIEIPTRVVSIALGWSHGLVLTDNGDVYSFGSELCSNGCLGLGTFAAAQRISTVTLEEQKYDIPNLATFKPIKLKLPGKAYAVFAYSTYSGFLIDDGGRSWPKRPEEQSTLDSFVGFRQK